MIRRNLIAASRFARMRLIVLRPASGVAEDEHVSASTKRTPQQEWEAAAREDRLDFLTASKMLMSEPPRPRKFGLDFHIVQFVLACMPSLAVYLVALYARSEMRRMEKEKEAREAERNHQYPPPAAEITDIKARLEAIEGVVQELRSEVTKPATSISADEGKKAPLNTQPSAVPTSVSAQPARQGPLIG